MIVLKQLDHPEFALMGTATKIESDMQRDSRIEQQHQETTEPKPAPDPQSEKTNVRQRREAIPEVKEKRPVLDLDGGDLIVTKQFRFLSPPTTRTSGKIEFLVFENSGERETAPTDFSRVRSIQYSVNIAQE